MLLCVALRMKDADGKKVFQKQCDKMIDETPDDVADGDIQPSQSS